MIKHRTLKPARLVGALFAVALATTPAFAVNKDMVQLQTQDQDLQSAVAHMQQSNDERMGVLKDLVQQTADAVNKMTLTVETMQQKMTSQQEAASGKVDQVSGQVQSLNDSLDEVKARLNAMEKALQGVQGQQQSINAALQNLTPQPGGAPPGVAAPQGAAPSGGGSQPQMQAAMPDNDNKPSADIPFATHQGAPTNPAPAPAADTPPVGDLYGGALKDYMAATLNSSSRRTSEFGQVIHAYPSDSLAGATRTTTSKRDGLPRGQVRCCRQELRSGHPAVPSQPQGRRGAPAQGLPALLRTLRIATVASPRCAPLSCASRPRRKPPRPAPSSAAWAFPWRQDAPDSPRISRKSPPTRLIWKSWRP